MPERNLTSASEPKQKGGPSPGATVSPDRTPNSPAQKVRAKKKRTVEVEIDDALLRGKRPSDEQLIQRQDSVYRLRLLGKTPEEIGQVLNVAPRTVRDYIAKARERQITELKRLEGKAGVLRQYGVLNFVLEESLEAWERSKISKKTKIAGVETKDGVIGSVGRGTETKKKTGQKEEEQVGDATYLDRAMKASKEIRELLGLDPPEVKRLLIADDPVVKGLENEDLRSLSSEELLRRYRATAGVGSELV